MFRTSGMLNFFKSSNQQRHLGTRVIVNNRSSGKRWCKVVAEDGMPLQEKALVIMQSILKNEYQIPSTYSKTFGLEINHQPLRLSEIISAQKKAERMACQVSAINEANTVNYQIDTLDCSLAETLDKKLKVISDSCELVNNLTHVSIFATSDKSTTPDQVMSILEGEGVYLRNN